MPSRHMKLFRNKEICISIMQIGCKNDMMTIYDRHLSINLQVPSVILQTFDLWVSVWDFEQSVYPRAC